MTTYDTGECVLDVPNLDAIDDAEELEQLADAFLKLSTYADRKARAVRMRLKGCIDTALAAEKFADSVYRQLPKWARW